MMEQLYGNLFGMLQRFRLPNEVRRRGNGSDNGKHRIDGVIGENGAGESTALVSA
jgi:hypothetical protein